jgi:hypothetical protein
VDEEVALLLIGILLADLVENELAFFVGLE